MKRAEICSIEIDAALAERWKAGGEGVWNRVCHAHLRLWVSLCGLKNNFDGDTLRARLDEVRQLGHAKYVHKHQDFDDVLLAVHRKGTDERQPMMKHALEERGVGEDPLDEIDIDNFMDAWLPIGWRERWQDEGTLTMDGVVDHLQEIQAEIDAEFEMYRHHYRPGAVKMGWLRNMFYSLTQQVIRMDPVVYALNVGLRQDKNKRLLPTGYIVKDTDGRDEALTGGSRAGFLHLDIAIGEYVKAARTGTHNKMLTCGVSLDEEEDDNCTICVPGSHKKTEAIWQKMGGQCGSGQHTTDLGKVWNGDYRTELGEPKPYPCKAYGMRCSEVNVVHGSAEGSHKKRRVVFPWFTGFGRDYAASDSPGTHSWQPRRQTSQVVSRPQRRLADRARGSSRQSCVGKRQ